MHVPEGSMAACPATGMLFFAWQSPELALTDDYAMSALTVAIWANRTRYAQRDFLRMTATRT
jgi:hypothetical protein